jgi:predicted ATPase
MKTKLIVVTGGPGGGKTTILEKSKSLLNEKSVIFPEAASIIFGGGFWRLPSISGKMAAQRAIFHVQREMENLVCTEKKWTMGLCDRGTLDGLAYWPEEEQTFFEMGHTSMAAEYDRYYAVIHLHSPTDILGYNHSNPLRTESALEARALDEQIAGVWRHHPRFYAIKSDMDFSIKVQKALDLILKFQNETV